MLNVDHECSRLSTQIGIQSLDSKQLELLGRKHSGEDGLRAVEEASAIFGPENVSFDLYVARSAAPNP